MSVDVRWNNFTNGIQQAGTAVVNGVGQSFNVLSNITSNVSSLEKVLRVGSQSVALARSHGHTASSLPRIARNLDKSLAIIDLTRIFSDAYYFLSGNFINDLKNLDLDAAFKSISFTIADSINTYLSIDGMLQAARGFERAVDDNSELLDKVANGFLVGGYLGSIIQNIRALVRSEGRDVAAGLDLAAAITSIAIPILVLSNVVCLPAFLALGALSLAFTGLGVVYELYRRAPQNNGPSLDFADTSAGLGTVLAPVSMTMDLLEGQNPVVGELVEDVSALRDLSSALGIINRGYEWFFERNKDGALKTVNGSVWYVGSKICSTAKSIMDVISWVDMVGIMDKTVRRNPLFKGLKNVFSLGAASLNLVETGIELHKHLPHWRAAAFKKHKWEVLSNIVEANPREALANLPSREEWERLRNDVAHYYDLKIQGELSRREGSANVEKLDHWQALRAAIQEGVLTTARPPILDGTDGEVSSTDSADDMSEEAAAEAAVEAAAEAALAGGADSASAAAVNPARGYLDLKKAALVRKLQALGEQGAVQAAVLDANSPARIVGYKKALADWNFRTLDVKKVSLTCKISADVVKVASAIANLVDIFFTKMLGTLPFSLDLLSAFVGAGKYFVDASYKAGRKPVANFAAAAA